MMKTTIKELKEMWDICMQHYVKDHRKMKLIDATDRADLWKALGTKFPPYQILPDTNWIAYVKSNLLASIYTVGKCADILPTSEEDKEIIVQLNIALERIWALSKVAYYQFRAGERASLLNMGITQVGWSENLSGGSGDAFYKGNVVLKNIDPMNFMRDPFAEDLDTSGFCMTFDTYHKSVFERNPLYEKEFKAYKQKNSGAAPPTVPEKQDFPAKGAAKDYYLLTIFWVREGKAIHEVHCINNEHILYTKENISPSVFPFSLLFSNEPAGALVGTSECVKIFANNVAYNLMDSIALTAEYKNQRPPKFISSSSGLNVHSFAKHGDEADRTFIVNGDASKAVHYHQFPQISQAVPNIKMNLRMDMQTITGVDGRYTGRDTGSIITTGGTEEMLNRVTLIDTPKISNYENYSKRLTQLILANMIEFSPKRSYFYKKPNSTKWESVTVDFPKIDKETLFDYEINISSELPKNKQRIAEMANLLMEKQMQYQDQGSSVQLITEEEWLMFQDLPNKEFMLERMGIQRLSDATEEVAQVLFQYADLVKNGMNPDDAILATSDSLKQKRMGMMPDQGMNPMLGQGGLMPPDQMME